jgi:hypothetical protein
MIPSIDSISDCTLILGAGFSKCADLPIQTEFSGLLLSNDFGNEINRVITDSIREFLKDVFGWSDGRELPSLEDIFTCIDLSAQTGHNLGIKYTPKKLRAIRRMAIYRIFSILDSKFSYSDDITNLLKKFCGTGFKSSFIVLNWDIVLEKHLLRLYPDTDIDYLCICQDWNNPNKDRESLGIPVSKMHGSSNWVYCDNCKALFSILIKNCHCAQKLALLNLTLGYSMKASQIRYLIRLSVFLLQKENVDFAIFWFPRILPHSVTGNLSEIRLIHQSGIRRKNYYQTLTIGFLLDTLFQKPTTN